MHTTQHTRFDDNRVLLYSSVFRYNCTHLLSAFVCSKVNGHHKDSYLRVHFTACVTLQPDLGLLVITTCHG